MGANNAPFVGANSRARAAPYVSIGGRRESSSKRCEKGYRGVLGLVFFYWREEREGCLDAAGVREKSGWFAAGAVALDGPIAAAFWSFLCVIVWRFRSCVEWCVQATDVSVSGVATGAHILAG